MKGGAVLSILLLTVVTPFLPEALQASAKARHSRALCPIFPHFRHLPRNGARWVRPSNWGGRAMAVAVPIAVVVPPTTRAAEELSLSVIPPLSLLPSLSFVPSEVLPACSWPPPIPRQSSPLSLLHTA